MSEPAMVEELTRPPRTFQRYPDSKESRVEWLEEIPSTWTVAPLYARYEVALGKMLDSKRITGESPGSYLRNVDVQWDAVNTENLPQMDFSPADRDRFLLRAGDLLVCEGGEVGRTAIWAGELAECFYQKAIHRVRPRSERESPRFLFYLMYAMAQRGVFVAGGNPNTIDHLTAVQLRRHRLPFAPPLEQRAIAAFLDREAARIDALVAKKERLIELLQEKRTALVTSAVTKGLDPKAPMKDSGVEWLGEIPAHWEIKRLWHLTPIYRRIMYGIVLPGPNVSDGVPIVKGGDVLPDRLRLDRLNRTTHEIESRYTRSRLRGGDLVYAIRGSIGEVAIVPAELEGANLTQDAARIAVTAAVHGPWLLHGLKSLAVFAQLEAGALGATIRGINIRDLKRASIAVPPFAEQRSIADFLEREGRAVDALLTKIRTAITHLHELRTALISAAVTGKIDVREEAA
jgi:type I restriction enzyme, S subunit